MRRPWSENPHGRQRTLYLIYDFINIYFCVLGLGIIALAVVSYLLVSWQLLVCFLDFMTVANICLQCFFSGLINDGLVFSLHLTSVLSTICVHGF